VNYTDAALRIFCALISKHGFPREKGYREDVVETSLLAADMFFAELEKKTKAVCVEGAQERKR
jgi:hypothetical protein